MYNLLYLDFQLLISLDKIEKLIYIWYKNDDYQ